MRTGLGEATTRRQPRPGILDHSPFLDAHAVLRLGARVELADRLAGFGKGGVARSTSVWVTTVATDLLRPRRRNSFSSAC